MEFAAVAAAALASAHSLVPRWLPEGKLRGDQWACGGVRGESGKSCEISLKTGKWKDHKTDEVGGDLISLLAAIRGVKQIDAAREIIRDLGLKSDAPKPAPAAPKPKEEDEWAVVRPAPDDLDYTWALTMRGLGKASRTWEYRDDDGRLHLVVIRWDTDEGKEIKPLSCWKSRKSGEIQWKYKHLPKPRPIYGHDRLAARPAALIVLCEGEKAADACEARFTHVVAIATEGGVESAVHTDWSILEGRDVAIWPDADQKIIKTQAQADKFKRPIGELIPHDHQPGIRYQNAAITALSALPVKSLQCVNLDLLSRALGRPLSDGFDAADLLPADQIDLTTVLVPVDIAPVQSSEDLFAEGQPTPAKTTPTVAAGAAPKSRRSCVNKFTDTMDAVRAYLRDRELEPDALDGWRDAKTWSLVREDLNDLGLHAWCEINAMGTEVPKTTITDILNAIADEMREKRRQSLIDSLAKGPATPEGEAAIAAYLKALTGHDNDWELSVLKHWIWMVKRSALMLPVQHHLMPVAYGPQGSGKSVAVNRLCQPWSELGIQINASYLTDDRRCPVLATAVTAIWDEMQGSAKADIEALKNMVTSSTISYRPMRTTQTVVQPRTCSFFGTSNLPVRVMVPDTTGARRFVQLDTPPRCDWILLNEIDPALIWQCVSINDPAPILPYLDRLREHQETLVHRDQVSQWLDAETWGQARIILSHEAEPVFIDAYNPAVGESYENISLRYHAWSRLIGQAPLSSKIFAIRLDQEGFTNSQPRLPNGKRTRMYKRPIDQLSQNEPQPRQDDSHEAIGF